MSEVEEVSKAVQEVAKFGTNALEKSDKVGSFLAKVFSGPTHETAGFVHDWFAYLRWRSALAIMDKVNEIHESRGVRDTRPVPPKFAIPFFREATLEEDPGIQDMWSTLLANRMDPKFNGEIRYGFMEIINNLTGIDVAILENLYSAINDPSRDEISNGVRDQVIERETVVRQLDITNSQYEISINNLMRLNCVGPSILRSNNSVTLSTGTRNITLTAFGICFIEACMR